MTIPRLLVVGSNGLLGQKVVEMFVRGSSADITASSVEPAPVRALHSVTYRQADITSKKDVRALVSAVEPTVIINCAAMTNVDACETERELAWKINVSGVEHLVDAAKRRMRRWSTSPPTTSSTASTGRTAEDDRPEPLSYYGKTKLASENVLRASDITYLIARTMVLYGYAEGVKAELRALADREPAEAEARAHRGRPDRQPDAGGRSRVRAHPRRSSWRRGASIISRGATSSAGTSSRSGWRACSAWIAGLITPIKTAHLKQPAPRPLKSGLITLKAEVEIGYRPVHRRRWAADRQESAVQEHSPTGGRQGPASVPGQQRPNEGRPGKRPS